MFCCTVSLYTIPPFLLYKSQTSAFVVTAGPKVSNQTKLHHEDNSLLSAVLALLVGLSSQNNSLTKEPFRLDIISKILEANKGINHNLVEGDVALSKKRNAMKCWSSYCKWKKSSNGQVEKNFHKKTCICFVLYRGQSDYLSIESESGMPFRIQTMEAGAFSVWIMGSFSMSSSMHLASITRSDRDRYVRLNWENIPAVSAHNFHKKDTNNLNTPYDYSSVMPYGRTAFASVYGADTITPIPDSSVLIGQRDEMSDIDILRINNLYNCSEYKRLHDALPSLKMHIGYYILTVPFVLFNGRHFWRQSMCKSFL
uniref:Metalloendopeptidase n=1 Tax=Labrus bergylta TaxID=56723 RepID=A0A3Q3GAG8_9LABR